MDVVLEQILKIWQTAFHAPDLGPVDEVFLIVCLRHVFHDSEGDAHAAVIGDVLANGEFAVDLAAMDFDSIELLNHVIGEFLEGGVVFLRPPGVKAAVLVELRTIVIKGMADLMSDDRADTAEVLFLGLLDAIERSLEDRGWEGNVVRERVIATWTCRLAPRAS